MLAGKARENDKSTPQEQGLLNQAREKSTKINFFGPETAWLGGGLRHEGVVAEKFVPSLESLSSLGFEERNLGCPWNFAGMSRTPANVQKICAKKSLCTVFIPTKGALTRINSSGIIFGALAGISGKSPRAHTEYCYQVILAILSRGGGDYYGAPLHTRTNSYYLGITILTETITSE